MQRHRTSRRCKPAVLFLPESSRYSQSVSFDACRFRADVAVVLVLAKSSRLLPVSERGCLLLLRFVTFFRFVSYLPVHLSFFNSGVAALPGNLDSLQDALWTFEYR